MDCSTPDFPGVWSLLKLTSIESMMSSNNSILCPLSSCSQSFPPSRDFNDLALHIRWPKGWHFCFSIIPSNAYSGLISFSIDWFDLIAIQGTIKSLFKHHNSKPSVLWCLASLRSNSHIQTWLMENDRFDYVGLFQQSDIFVSQTLSRFVIAFLLRSKHLLTSWLQSLSAVVLEPKKVKSVTVSTLSPYICHEVMGLDTKILIFWMLNFKPAFWLSSFTFIKRLFSSSSLSAIEVVSSAYLRLLIFLLAV